MPGKVPGAAAPPAYSEIIESFARYVAEERPKVSAPADAAALMRPVLASKKQEEFHVLLLDAKNAVLKDLTATTGLLDRTQIHPREVFREAVRENCSRVLLVHNHPSGDPTPSSQDISATRQLQEAGKIIGIDVLDHVIIGSRTQSREQDWVSFRSEKLF